MLPKKSKNNLVRFLNKHFPDATENYRGGNYEWRFECPFCRGGLHNDVSFDMNVDKGVGRCWRASCDWRGSAVKFVQDYSGMDYAAAEEVIKGGAEVTEQSVMLELGFLDQLLEEQYDQADLFVGGIREHIEGAVPLEESKERERIHDWITGVRGYELEDFLSKHELFVPYQIGRGEGRVMFSVQTEDDYAYILYSFEEDRHPKTLNPPGAVLSNMLYNYNNVRQSRVVFVVEGIFDCARLMSWGWNAVCCFGISPQKAQYYLLSKLEAEEIVVCFDHGAEDKAKQAVSEMKKYISDKDLCFMKIERDGADPDDLTEKEFFRYYMRRKILRRNTVEKSLDKLKGLDFGYDV